MPTSNPDRVGKNLETKNLIKSRRGDINHIFAARPNRVVDQRHARRHYTTTLHFDTTLPHYTTTVLHYTTPVVAGSHRNSHIACILTVLVVHRYSPFLVGMHAHSHEVMRLSCRAAVGMSANEDRNATSSIEGTKYSIQHTA